MDQYTHYRCPEKERKEQRLFEEIRAENFLNLMKYVDLQIKRLTQ